MSAPVSQPSMDCGPPMEAINSGIVMKGPIPTMFDMFRAVAGSKPNARVRWGCVSVFIAMGVQDRKSSRLHHSDSLCRKIP